MFKILARNPRNTMRELFIVEADSRFYAEVMFEMYYPDWKIDEISEHISSVIRVTEV